MNIDRVKAIASDPKRTRKELEQMRENATAQGNVEGRRVIEEVLQARFPAADDAFDRMSPMVAASVLESLFPRKSDRMTILARLLHSIAIANEIAPRAWAVSLFPDFFRLNVGQVEVYVADAGGFYLNCCASAEREPFETLGFEPIHYAPIPDPQCNFRGSPSDLKSLPPEVLRAHAQFVEFAARSPSGNPRAGTPFKKSHSEGLVTYATELVGAVKRGA
jgi:hypothetical protein